ncbi:DNA methyltransferase [Sphingomonas bacterium]|uniref:DNA methyltransferase n=1 Tax=Sphingomonas bacterium TaxID=1895847 RepID=UPI001575194B|nr:DNA methyltransferase [Sphingomonas bacterium]
MTNRLYYGDNLDVLREHVGSASVDLVYLDPPFNSNANYNILFKSPAGASSDAQIEAFEDTWHWNDKAEDAFDQVARSGNTKAFDLLNAMRGFLGENDMMAYLAMMAIRLIELHRVLKPTGSLYLHCDPTASHYLKLLLDGVFGADNYRSEITWLRSRNPKGSQHENSQWGSATDTIFFYAKSRATKLNINAAKRPTEERELVKRYPHVDTYGRWADGPILRSGSMGPRPTLVYEYHGFTPGPAGWRCTIDKLQEIDAAGDLYWTASGGPRRKVRPDDNELDPLSSCWTDIPPINSQAQERLGYPTQKPLALLERIIAASSNPGDIVLDPFCGCGTAVHAAQKLGRQWIGIDVTHLAISLIEKRMRAAFPAASFTVEGTPKDLAGAEDLAARDKYQFQWWAVSMVDAMPFGGRKKGADGGIDGIIYFKPDGKKTEKAIVSVKGGDNVGVQMIRDLHSAMEREKAPIGVFITKAMPTTAMLKEAAAVGRFHSEATGKSYPRLQILTLAELMVQGKKPDIPYVDPGAAFRKAGREDTAKQGSLL